MQRQVCRRTKEAEHTSGAANQSSSLGMGAWKHEPNKSTVQLTSRDRKAQRAPGQKVRGGDRNRALAAPSLSRPPLSPPSTSGHHHADGRARGEIERERAACSIARGSGSHHVRTEAFDSTMHINGESTTTGARRPEHGIPLLSLDRP